MKNNQTLHKGLFRNRLIRITSRSQTRTDSIASSSASKVQGKFIGATPTFSKKLAPCTALMMNYSVMFLFRQNQASINLLPCPVHYVLPASFSHWSCLQSACIQCNSSHTPMKFKIDRRLLLNAAVQDCGLRKEANLLWKHVTTTIQIWPFAHIATEEEDREQWEGKYPVSSSGSIHPSLARSGRSQIEARGKWRCCGVPKKQVSSRGWERPESVRSCPEKWALFTAAYFSSSWETPYAPDLKYQIFSARKSFQIASSRLYALSTSCWDGVLTEK